MKLPEPHRLAKLYALPRALSFGYAFVILVAIAVEGHFATLAVAAGAIAFVSWPVLAYLHACYAPDSKQAEFRNLVADGVILGVACGLLDYAVWPTCAMLCAVSLNNAASGGVCQFAKGVGACILTALVVGGVRGFPFQPDNGPLVIMMTALGIWLYVAFVGFTLYQQNRKFIQTRNALHASEEVFQFIAENAGDLVAVLDAKGRVVYASGGHLKLFNPEQVAVGADWFRLARPEDEERLKHRYQVMMLSGRRERVRALLATRQGAHREFDFDLSPVRFTGGSADIVVLVGREVLAAVEMDREEITRPAGWPNIG